MLFGYKIIGAFQEVSGLRRKIRFSRGYSERSTFLEHLSEKKLFHTFNLTKTFFTPQSLRKISSDPANGIGDKCQQNV